MTHTFFCLTMDQPPRSNSVQRFDAGLRIRVRANVRGVANGYEPAGPLLACPEVSVIRDAGLPLLIGLRRQEVHLVFGRDADDLGDIRQIMKLIEQGFELLGGRHPE